MLIQMCKNFLSLEDSLEIGFFICENSNYEQHLTDFNTLNSTAVISYQRNLPASDQVSKQDLTEFFVINSDTGTVSNGFPINSPGVLQVMNLYNTRYIQYYHVPRDSAIYKRYISDPDGSWSDWKLI